METPLTFSINSFLSVKSLIGNPSLSLKISENGRLRLDHLKEYIESQSTFQGNSFTVHEIKQGCERVIGIEVDAEQNTVSHPSWANLVYAFKIEGVSLAQFYELEEVFKNNDFSQLISKTRYLGGESAMFIEINLDNPLNEGEFIEFIDRDEFFSSFSVKTLTKPLYQLVMDKHHQEQISAPIMMNSQLPSTRMRLASMSEKFITKSNIMAFFLQNKYRIRINKSLLACKSIIEPILNEQGDFRIEELEPLKKSDFFNSKPRHKLSFNLSRKGSFKKPMRKGSHRL